MMNENTYDIAIIGGGLAGLTMSIRLATSGFKVILFEKEQYPFHKVCGEYISMESHDYLLSLGVPLSDMNLPYINKLIVTAPSGNKLKSPLSLGGFGVSRYLLDNTLKNIAITKGAVIHEECKVHDVVFENELFSLTVSGNIFTSKVCCGAFGKRSNLDVKWQRTESTKNNKYDNYIAVKYHIEAMTELDTIALHNFSDGYCGISSIEDGRSCLCYMTTANNLQKCGSIEKMENEILSVNPHLKYIFDNCKKLYQSPVTISQLSFHKKTQVVNHTLMIGDASGMITPLCGNGMSMAMHGGKIASELITSYLHNKITRNEMEGRYSEIWKKLFGRRINAGRTIQSIFGKPATTNLFISVLRSLPFITKKLIRLTHGKPF